MARLLTLCMVRRGGTLLLGMKKRGFGAGRWNGFGGKVEDGETVEQAAVRELREEAGIAARSLSARGRLRFTFASGDPELDVRVFAVDAFDGEPVETEEMRPAWFAEDALPFDAMWPDDRHWVPLFLAGASFQGAFRFGDGDAILDRALAPLPPGAALW